MISFKKIKIKELTTSVFAVSPTVGIKTGTGQISTILDNAITWALGLVGATAILFIIYGGFIYITSAGNKERAENAKKTLTYAVAGLVIVILARVIISLIDNSIGSLV